jgi:hypothetical protein
MRRLMISKDTRYVLLFLYDSCGFYSTYKGYNYLREKMHYDFLIRFGLESYIEIVLSSLIQLKDVSSANQ